MKKLFGKGCVAVFTAFAALGLLLSYSVRNLFVFVDNVIFKNASFTFFVVSVITTVFMFAVLCLEQRGKKPTLKLVVRLLLCLGYFCGVAMIIYPVVVLITDSGESFSTIAHLLMKNLPIWSVSVFGFFFIFLFPALKNGLCKKIVSVISGVALTVVVVNSLFPLTPFEFKSGPIVLDNGEGGYSVVFATTDKATGYVDYSLNGEQVRVYDQSAGRKNGQSVIHTVCVPKEALSGNTYKVGATRLIDELSYGGRTGKTIESDTYKLNDNFGNNINILSVSDWHTKNNLALKAVSNIQDDYQAVVFLGDSVPGLVSEYDVSKYIIEFGYKLTGGQMPIIFTRGNHETRGGEAVNLSKWLGIENFYYQTNLGNYNLIVLDSCEDKDDSHPEYGGMVDYKNYRSDMVNWLENLKKKTDSKTICFCHSKDICIEEDLSARALKKLKALDTGMLISGHEHVVDYKEDADIPYLVDGGINSDGNGTYVASLLKISPSEISVQCVSDSGKHIVDSILNW